MFCISSFAATTTLPILSIKTPSVSVEVDQMQNVRTIQIILSLPRPTFNVSSLRPSIPASLSFGLNPYLPYLSLDLPQFISLSSLALFLPPKGVPHAALSLMVADSPTEGANSSPTHGLLPLPTSSHQ